MTAAGLAQTNSFLIYTAMAVFVVARFLIRELRERRVDPRRLFVVPAVVGAAAIAFVVAAAIHAPGDLVPLAVGVLCAVVVGFAVGVGVARFTTVRIVPGESAFFMRGSYASTAVWIGALLLRVAVRLFVGRETSIAESEVANAALFVMLAAALLFVRLRVLATERRERAAHDAGPAPAI